MTEPRIGGSFAPPLSDALLTIYKALIDSLAPRPVKDAMQLLINCCQKWWELPESSGAGVPHASGRGVMVRLDEVIADQLDEHIPWPHELQAIQALFDGIDPVAEPQVRDAAFHLLWHVKELDLGREPITTDRL